MEIRNWWLYSLNVTDRTNIVCFIIFMMISATLTGVVIKMKLPIWKLQMGSILLHDFAAVILLIVRLTNGWYQGIILSKFYNLDSPELGRMNRAEAIFLLAHMHIHCESDFHRKWYYLHLQTQHMNQWKICNLW